MCTICFPMPPRYFLLGTKTRSSWACHSTVAPSSAHKAENDPYEHQPSPPTNPTCVHFSFPPFKGLFAKSLTKRNKKSGGGDAIDLIGAAAGFSIAK